MNENRYLTIPQTAKILGLTRIAVYYRVKKGKLKAMRIGRNYLINEEDIVGLHKPLSQKEKIDIERVVDKVVKDYGEALKKLGSE